MSIVIPPADERDGINIEFCSGYIDETGKWNTGFYCPNDGDTQAFFCCGTSAYKYCCTYKDLVEEDTFKSWYIIIGVVIGVSLTIVLTTVVCRTCCSAYKKVNVQHQSSSGGGLYQLQASSTSSGVANMYSFGNNQPQHATHASTPHDSDDIGTTRAVSQLILELESQIVTNESFSHHNHQIKSCPDTTELCPPISYGLQPSKSALNLKTLDEERVRSVTNGISKGHPEDIDALYRSTKF